MSFWELVLASVLGFLPGALGIYWVGFRAGRRANPAHQGVQK